jgi:2-polyprenyl-3-methyl-5-hydroxy-6-metoxy-1,4-benzoquinol methylase
MAADGWSVEGVEPSPAAASTAASGGLRIQSCTVEDAMAPEVPVDLVVGWMVLEHLHDPVAALKKFTAWTKPEAWLALSVPNAGSAEFRVFREAWYALQVPTHLFHFSPATVRRVMQAGGWRVERVLHQRVLSNLVASVGHALEGRPRWRSASEWLIRFPERPGKAHALLYPLATVLAAAGETGRMTVWARKAR